MGSDRCASTLWRAEGFDFFGPADAGIVFAGFVAVIHLPATGERVVAFEGDGVIDHGRADLVELGGTFDLRRMSAGGGEDGEEQCDEDSDDADDDEEFDEGKGAAQERRSRNRIGTYCKCRAEERGGQNCGFRPAA